MKEPTFIRAKAQAWAWGLLAALVALVVGLTWPVDAQTTQPTTRPARGVWYQPVESFDKWKARGIDTLIGVETNDGAVAPRQYLDAAAAKGLKVWVQHPLLLADPSLATHQATAGAINAPDEPDGGGNTTPVQCQVNYATIKAAFPWLRVLINFDGSRMAWRPDADYVEYCKAADVIFMDYYPLNGGQGPTAIPDIGARLKRLAKDSGGKPLGAFIECSNQLLGEQPWTQQDDGTGVWLSTKMRGPTAGEFGQEVHSAVVDGGATSIGYFPDVIGKGWVGFDGVPDDIAAAMTQLNATLTVPFTAGAVAASSGTSATPAATQPATAPNTKPTTQAAQVQLKHWLTMARDYNHRRIVLTWTDSRGKSQTTLITDPAAVAAIDAAAGK